MGNNNSSKKHDLHVDRSKSQVHEDWTMSPAELRGSQVTVFSAIHPPSSKKREFIEKSVQFSKIYRHPGILKYIEGGVYDGEIVVVTEKTSPLLEHDLETMPPLELTAGLLSILETLIFLHDKAGVSHNNVGPSSIFITADGTWKLWCLEYSCSFGELTRDTIDRINQYCSEKFIPPDEKNRISPGYQHARDCYAFAKFITSIADTQNSSEVPFLDDFVRYLKENALTEDWNKRVRLSSMLEHQFFKHEFLQLRHNVLHALLLSDDIKEDLIRTLPDTLKMYPEDLIASTLLPTLLSRPILHIQSTEKYLLPCLMIPESSGGLLTAPTYKQFMIPLILKLFSIYDATIRRILLHYFQHYVPMMTDHVLTKQVLPQLLLGIRDSDDQLVAETLQCLAALVPILGASVVVGSRRQNVFGKSTSNKRTKTVPSQPMHDIRSAPDGGEVIGATMETPQEDGQWSDWEEILEDSPASKTRTQSLSSNTSSNSSKHGKTHNPVNTSKKNMASLAVSPGDEQNDEELDLFADLKPQLKRNTFNLETMLIKATHECSLDPSLPSVSNTLADIDDIEEGDGWGDNTDWAENEAQDK